jgi:hypothetical protein
MEVLEQLMEVELLDKEIPEGLLLEHLMVPGVVELAVLAVMEQEVLLTTVGVVLVV